MKYSPAIHPERVPQLLARSWLLYRFTFFKVFLLSLVLSTIAFIPRIIALIAGHDVVSQLSLLNPNQLWILLIYIVDLTLFMAILWRLQCVTTDAHESLLDDIRTGLRKVPLILVAAIAQFLLFMAVTITTVNINLYLFQPHHMQTTNILEIFYLGLPAAAQMVFCVYVTYLFYFYFPIILTENKGAFAALARSAKLVWGNWWKSFWAITTPWILYILTLILFTYFGFQMHVYFFTADKLTLSATLLHIIIFAVYIPWFAATALVVLRDLELRNQPPKKPRNRIKKETLTSI